MLKLKLRTLKSRTSSRVSARCRWSFDPAAAIRMRKAAQLTIREVAEQTGLAEQTVVFMEKGVTQPRAGTLGMLAHVYDVEPNAFFAKRSPSGTPS